MKITLFITLQEHRATVFGAVHVARIAVDDRTVTERRVAPPVDDMTQVGQRIAIFDLEHALVHALVERRHRACRQSPIVNVGVSSQCSAS